MNLLVASCKVAFAAMTRNLGMLSRHSQSTPNSHASQQQWEELARHHPHLGQNASSGAELDAAHTMLALEALRQYWPDISPDGILTSSASNEEEGKEEKKSLIDAGALSGTPQTPLQWIIALAARLAVSFENDAFEEPAAQSDSPNPEGNPGLLRLYPFFERIAAGDLPASSSGNYQYSYLPGIMSAESIFPVRQEDADASSKATEEAYQALWQSFVTGLEKIPHSHRKDWALWTDHFDSLWLNCTHAIPSDAAQPDISLYDHSKVSAALAVALWRHLLDADRLDVQTIRELPENNEAKPFLFIQGDFYGIQNFIFPESSETNRQAAKILRGRSFQVSLFTELASLRILQALDLPAASQIINAAGKFLIVAPNTPQTIDRIREIQLEFDTWFIRHTFGTVGIGLAWHEAACADFAYSSFSNLSRSLFESLEAAKHQRQNLCMNTLLVLDADFPLGSCAWQGRFPADQEGDNENPASSALSRDQILMGESLLSYSHVLVYREEDAQGMEARRHLYSECEVSVFGYRIRFSDEVAQGEAVTSGSLLRCWDISLPQQFSEELWNGYSRRQINGYVPRFATKADDQLKGRYGADLAGEVVPGQLKTFSHIACEDRTLGDRGVWRGQRALAILKGDVDNLGVIFQRGLNDPQNGQYPSFAKMTALSRQMNAFFAVVLPVLCQTEYPDVYTVFAGGDDFFLIGPWLSTQRLAGRLVEEFDRYVAKNSSIHLCAGLVVSAPGTPVPALAREAEDALADAKQIAGKNAFSLWGVAAPWQFWPQLGQKEQELEELRSQYSLSTGYMYGLLELLNRRLLEDVVPEATLWRSSFAYRTARMLERRSRQDRQEAQRHLVRSIAEEGMINMKGAFRISLFNHLYQQR